MWPFRQSLGVDHVDRCNTWAVLFLLLLALITWLLPLSPVSLSQAMAPGYTAKSEPIMSQAEPAQKVRRPTRYVANCWCPAQFTAAHVAYTHGVCEGAFNFILNGGNASEAPAKLFTIRQPGAPEPAPFGPDMVESENWERAIEEEKAAQQKRQRQQEQKLQQQRERAQELNDKAAYFFLVTTPLSIFLMAVCLAIPRLVWNLLSCLVSGINVDQTLVSAKEGSKLDHDSRQQLHAELAKAAREASRASPWRTSTLYFLLKLLMCVAVVAEAIVVHNSFLPQARGLKQDLQENKFNLTGPSSVDTDNTVADTSKATQNSTASMVLFCGYKMRILQAVQNYEMQCVFSPVIDPAPAQPTPTVASLPSAKMDTPPQESASFQVYMYESVYLIILTTLVALAVSNVASLLVWLVKLTCRPCQDSNLPLDTFFLLQMARENAGLDFASVLSKTEAKQDSPLPEDMEMKA
ncbi:pannexin 10 [Elysia marginata]|uniref:Pannexin 10 n=1 Tax=Elysia marginata TaxID=1093978 RepID=A0AAV4JY07_9GAST|nr:pannexin 10 [Elysia marginata]